MPDDPHSLRGSVVPYGDVISLIDVGAGDAATG
jgi:hypothetical protein